MTNLRDALRGKRTFILSGLAIVTAVADAYFGVLDADPQATAAVVAMAVLMSVMRVLTTTPPGRG